MKALILTFHYVDNYGAVLQAFALQRYLNQSGIETKILDYRPGQYGFKDYTFQIKNTSFKSKLKSFIYGNIKALLSIKRKRNFRLFCEKYLCLTKEKFHNFSDLANNIPYADMYIVGSDQVWNDEITGQSNGYLLPFVKNQSLKISYAASIGKDNISKEYAKKLKEHLESFDFISVREETAKTALENVGLKNVTTTLDPVFLLDAKDYEDLLITPTIDDYVFIYCFDNNEQCYSLAQQIAKKNNLKTISFSGWTNKFRTDYFINSASPTEFLSYLKNAKYVVTNSFHGTAFSIIFEKEFYTIPPIARVSRITSLLDVSNLKNRLITNVDNIENIECINYAIAKLHLSKSIDSSKDYLNNAIAGVSRKESML